MKCKVFLVNPDGSKEEIKPKPTLEYRKKPVVIKAMRMYSPFEVETLEGTMRGNIGDWLIKGVNGEMYPCKPDIFKKTYEEKVKPDML